ncbi:hypothetical protein JXA32_08330 [Candidatus Sumerlaeota bacterium]|nr:hypothetical protein [Candidatus Sumerlaeota bacterium]
MGPLCRWTFSIAILAIAFSATACVGIRSNEGNFLNPPERGISELELLLTYGKPDFTAAVEDQKVYIYSVVSEKYIIAVGMSGSYDLIVTCRDGEVVDTKRIKSAGGISILQPNTWQVD